MTNSTPSVSASTPWTLIRFALALLLLTAALAAVGCGSDNEKKQGSTGAQAQQPTGAPADTSQDKAPTGKPGTTRPEVQKTPPGKEPNAGDEEPIRSPAEFTGKGGRIQPPSIGVPPFIAVMVTLRSSDSRAYTLKVAGHTLKAAPRSSASVSLPGIRPGKRYVATIPGGGSVQVVASAEPGP
jgi:hypothetical protein